MNRLLHPSPDEWTLVDGGADPTRRRAVETLFSLSDGDVGTRGAVEEPAAGSSELVLAAGVYTGSGPDEQLLPAPLWTCFDHVPELADDVRTLDLRSGVLTRTGHDARGRTVRITRFASAARPGIVALRADSDTGVLRAGPSLRRPVTPHGNEDVSAPVTCGVDGRTRRWMQIPGNDATSVFAIADQQVRRDGSHMRVDRIAAYLSGLRLGSGLDTGGARLDDAVASGFDALLAEHRAQWAQRWDTVDVRILGQPELQQAVRFALFHLWGLAGNQDELAVGARGLSGPGYRGHVFWDTDVFVLPAMASIAPAAAEAMARYRIRRLAAARQRASACGHVGARFPWESASSGADVTPVSGRLGEQTVPILTGFQEEHVTADVAWSLCHLAEWSGTDLVQHPDRCEVLFETARYWVSRSRRDADGRLHIREVIGPDEYHETVHDNAFTNGMARWNLRAAAALARRTGYSDLDAAQWEDAAERLVDGYDEASGRYEQFAGYFDLEPLVIADVARPPVAADLLLGRDRVTGSQLIKQPDVLMLHRLIPDSIVAGSLEPNLDFYEPRTAHGSSLSPAVGAELLARAGRPDEALELFTMAARLDLDDTTQFTAAGLHVATLAGVWQALLCGFAGVHVRDRVMHVRPHLPTSWPELHLRFRCLGAAVRLTVTPAEVEVVTDAPLTVVVDDLPARRVERTVRVRRTRPHEGART